MHETKSEKGTVSGHGVVIPAPKPEPPKEQPK